MIGGVCDLAMTGNCLPSAVHMISVIVVFRRKPIGLHHDARNAVDNGPAGGRRNGSGCHASRVDERASVNASLSRRAAK